MYITGLILALTLLVGASSGEVVPCGTEGHFFGNWHKVECEAILQDINAEVGKARSCNRFGGCTREVPYCRPEGPDDCVQHYAAPAIVKVDRHYAIESAKLQCTIGTYTLTTHRWTAETCAVVRQVYDECLKRAFQVEACFGLAVASHVERTWFLKQVIGNVPRSANTTAVIQELSDAIDKMDKVLADERAAAAEAAPTPKPEANVTQPK